MYNCEMGRNEEMSKFSFCSRIFTDLTQYILPLLLMNSLPDGALFDGVQRADERNFSLLLFVCFFYGFEFLNRRFQCYLL